MKLSGLGFFVGLGFLNQSFDIIACDCSLHIFYFFLIGFCKIVPKNLSASSRLSSLLA